MTKKIIRKAFVNKKTKQLSISIPKKQIKKIDPTIRFSDNLFFELKVIKEKEE